MADFNRVILMGRLTRDIELRYTPSGLAVTDVGVAVNDRRKNQDDEWIEETTFVDVTLWGRTAEVAGEYLSKGSPIFVEGRLKLDSWETEGQKKSKLRVVCERMQMVGSRGGFDASQRDESEHRQPARVSANEPVRVSADEPARVSADEPAASGPPDEDIPF